MGDTPTDRCCAPEDAWVSVEKMASGALKGTIKSSILVEFIEHALGVGPCLEEKILDCLRRHSAIMSEPRRRRELTYGVSEAGLLRWAEDMAALALDEARPDAAAELAEILDDWLRLLQGWGEATPSVQQEPVPHFSQERTPTLFCQNCGHGEPRLAWREMVDGRAHLGAYCVSCGRWLRWVPQSGEWLRSAPAKETVRRVAA